MKEVSNIEVLESLKTSFGLPVDTSALDDSFLACSVRRTAGILCPCSTNSIVSAVLQSLSHLIVIQHTELKQKLEEIVERLIIGGDLLELSEVSISESNAKSTWIFPAHPAFLVRPNGSVLIFGIVPDENSPIQSLANRIVYEDCKRILVPHVGEDMQQILIDLGLVKVTESSWLRLPKKVTHKDFLSKMNNLLLGASGSTEISCLSVLDSSTKNTYYRGRWKNAENLTGNFVARRPYIYGSNIWCYVQLQDGRLIKFVDIPFNLNGVTQRGCDGGWQLQMAIDHSLGFPQVYSITPSEDGDVFSFYSPLPLWAERRLIAIGRRVQNNNCLFSYLIPKKESSTEETFLSEHLWLSRS